MIDRILRSELFESCFAYIDDIIVFGETISEVIARTKRVLALLFADGLKIGGLKCHFVVERVELLGRTLEAGGKYPTEDKLQGLKELRPPTTVKEVRSLHGCLSFLREFVPKFS